MSTVPHYCVKMGEGSLSTASDDNSESNQRALIKQPQVLLDAPLYQRIRLTTVFKICVLSLKNVSSMICRKITIFRCWNQTLLFSILTISNSRTPFHRDSGLLHISTWFSNSQSFPFLQGPGVTLTLSFVLMLHAFLTQRMNLSARSETSCHISHCLYFSVCA